MSVPSSGKQKRNTSQSGEEVFPVQTNRTCFVCDQTHAHVSGVAMSSREPCCIHFSVCKVGTGSPTVTMCVAAALVPR